MSSYPQFNFQITQQDANTNARLGQLTTPHGTLQTPNFIFCGTKAALKGVTTAQAKDAGADIILSNTYHLLLQPGPDIMRKLGGLHKMLQWDAPMLTDSGGFQVFSLNHGGIAREIKGSRGNQLGKTLLKITEEGAQFRSYVDGRPHLLTPEIAIQTQRALGADLIVAFDECTPFHSTKDETAAAMERSHRWEKRSLDEFWRTQEGEHACTTGLPQALYGVIQGGVHKDLRTISADFVTQNNFFGNAVGGCLGENKTQMYDIVNFTMSKLNRNRPTHLLGIGGITDIWHGVAHGIDTFDCVHPTRLARHGGALVDPMLNDGKENIQIRNTRFKDDDRPIDETLDCYTSNFSRGYIHHLFKANESLAGTLLSIHNIAFMARLARQIRSAIADGTYAAKMKDYLSIVRDV